MMISKKEVLNSFKVDNKTGFADSNFQGGVGVDNIRENIDRKVFKAQNHI